MTDDLFGEAPGAGAVEGQPLAERLRPRRLDEVVGQEALLGPGGALTRMLGGRGRGAGLPGAGVQGAGLQGAGLQGGRLASLILWGPPGVGKTTIARLLAEAAGLGFMQVSAVFSGVAELRRVFEQAARARAAGRASLLFVDEIHRFNRAQQDAFLPVVEDGTLVLVGATTENPSFALGGALLSRCQVVVLRRLDDDAMERLLGRAEALAGRALALDAGARAGLRAMADGDGRALLNMAEQVLALGAEAGVLDAAALAGLLSRRAALHDRAGDGHYNLLSALHKSLRGSDPDAALYWYGRMLEGGEDVRVVARRLVRFASEDVGLADPQALVQALAAWEAYERLGSPEGELCVAQAIVYLGTAPKSNALYVGQKAARAAARERGSLSPPAHILNAPTRMMREMGHGAGYAYDHDTAEAFSGQDYFPAGMGREEYYRPKDRGFERELARRLAHWAGLRGAK